MDDSMPWDFPGKNTVMARMIFPSPRHLPNPGIKPAIPAWAGGFFNTEPPGKPKNYGAGV